ncbi:MAG: hypothetical protein A2W97_06670 [Bacteroidetes bacterium GWE2_40_63]|nr:MAG: hypothetical protein A2W95_11255 [Bacteroidetes bacterium GWA2_40_14]OFX60725.1 MAG: hypothetical protein A2W84_09450 [Bacteroidetes bacterium GWC2_40_13]OFX73920.1 MAG: hypothetical protein A2W96_11400 [Bacteroidetes bacterium GWD2_40_43]OFX93246.1 MAG: hypothetical protein A2W97_06670 [Bacteroidetes bacterium GWE2_40_63]OFY17692.1 MAG: hypothetical protein A2W88_00880 [Bacteroidetes bacterium GWF2_40_13]OFZ24268.1 MAG: hypothetical protein A2437_17805 [Bacteroidetes bacterium RIFOXYC
MNLSVLIHSLGLESIYLNQKPFNAMKRFYLLWFAIGSLAISQAQIKPEKKIETKGQYIYCIAYNHDGSFIASSGDKKEVIIHKTGTYEEVAHLKGLKDIPLSVCFSNNGKLIAAGGKDNKITVWDIASQQVRYMIKAHDAQVMDLAFSPDDKTLASTSLDKEIKLWDAQTGQLVSSFTGNKKEVTSLDFSPDGSRLVSGHADGTIKIWEVKKASLYLNIPGHKGWVFSVAFSPDGSLIASGGEDKQIHLWDAYSGEKLNTFLGHRKWVQGVAFSPDGNYLLSGSHDNHLILTHIKTGKMVFQSEKQPNYILSIGFNPKGTSFAAAALYSDILEIWDAKSLNIKVLEKQEAQKAMASTGMAPSIEWLNPKTGGSITNPSLKVTAKITSESSLRTIDLLVNGKVFATKDRSELMLESAEKTSFTYEENIILSEGNNAIQLKARNIAGESMSQPLDITFSSTPVVLLTWTAPLMPASQTNLPTYSIRATINPQKTAQKVDLMVNNQWVASQNFTAEGGIISKQITLKEGENRVSFKVATNEFTKESETRTITYAVAGKPTIVFLQPQKDTSCFISGIRFKASVQSQIPIDFIELKVNGLTVYSKNQLPDNHFTIDQHLQLTPGQNNITITARNQAGEVTSPTRMIAYQLPEKTNISWVSPSSDIEIFEPFVDLRACIQSKSEVLKIELYSNDALVATENQPQKNGTGECTIDFAKKIPLSSGTNKVKISATNAGGITQSEVRQINYILPQAAVVQWQNPTAFQVATSENFLNISVSITSNTQLESIDLLLNGQVVASTPFPKPLTGSSTYSYQQKAPLNKGSNVIMLKTKNRAGEVMSTPIIAEYKASNPYRFALIIGNEDYSSYQTGLNSESNVDFAKKDAQDFKQLCIGTLNVQEENIIYLEDARYTEMMKSLKKISGILSVTQGKAEVFVFYAGHGFPDEKTKEPYLVPVDGSGTDLDITGVKLTYFYEMLTSFPAQRITVFLDACFSGGARNQGLVAARGVKVIPKETPEAVKKNLVVFTASSGNQTSLPYKEKQHGLFTYFLVHKLTETKGDITYEELSNYLKEQVSIKSVMVNSKQQDPQTNVSPEVEAIWQQWKFSE